MKARQKDDIQNFIISNVEKHPKDITALTAVKFSVSRQAVLKHINKLIEENQLAVTGNTRDRAYSLKPIAVLSLELPLENLEEDIVWRERVSPLLKDAPDNINRICYYGFTEMLNNAIDHSNGQRVKITVERGLKDIQLTVADDGMGIFNKIQKEFGLHDILHAILELSKGKITTDPKRHTGEGIFFSSRIFDEFSITSGNLHFAHFSKPENIEGSDWLIENKTDTINGTKIYMKIGLIASRTTKKVFDYYSDDDFGFTKTNVPVFLAQYGEENLISRSQAKRLLTRFDRFKEIVLDFQDVESIGQAFSDEIFRVFQNEHPHINLSVIHANEQVAKMIKRAKSVL